MAIIDKRFLYYTTEAGFLKDKNDGKIDSKSVVFLSENGKRAIYTHGKFFNPEAFVVGTQSSSTNAFTGVFNEIDSLYDGLNIRYWLPYNGTSSAATLNLTIGDTTTGAIPVYIKGTTRFTNHIGGTNVLDLTYRENVGGIEKGWWVLGSYGDAADGNTTYTFTSGTDGSFKVKPSNGSEQTVSIGKPGTAGTADKVGKSFVVQINSGEEEYVSKYTFDGSTAKTINISQGSNISFGVEDGELTINGNYKNATTTDSGLMSSDDKEKLDGIEEGANNYEHPSHTEYSSGLYKITVDAEGHVESATKVVKSDITSLGIPAQDTNTHYESKNIVGSTATSTTNTTSVLNNGNVYLNSIENGVVTSSHKISGKGATTVKTDASGNIEINSPTTIAWGSVTGKPSTFTPSDHEHTVSDITDFPETQELSVNGTTYDVYTSETSLPSFYAPSTLGTNGQVLKSDGTKLVWGKDNNDNTWRGVALTDGTTDTSVLGTGTNTGSLKFKAGSNVSLSASNGVITVNSSYTDTNTTYTFASGTDGSFSVTPKGGSKQTVSIGKPAEAGTADEVINPLTITVNSGTEEGTNKYTFTGADSKTLNITAGSNVTLTPSAGGLQISSSYTNTDEKVKVTTGTTTKSYLVGVNSSGYTSGNATDKLITDTSVYLDTTAGKLTATTLNATTLSGNLKGTIDSTTTATTPSVGDKSTKVATTAFVDTAISTALGSLADAMIFKGIVNANTDLPASHEVGWTYRVGTKGTYAGIQCEVGDLIICITDGTSANNAHWTVAQNNIDGAVTGPTSSTDGNFALFSGTTGKIIKNSSYSPASFTYTAGTGLSLSNNKFSIDSDLTEGTYGPEANVTGTDGTTVVIPQIKVDENGLISEISEFTYTSKDTNTHYTTGLYIGASGAKSNAATSNGSTYIKLYDNDVSRASFKISGSGATTVKSDSSGNITITSSNDNTTYTLSGVLDGDTFKSTLTPSSGTATTSIVPVFLGATSSAAGKAGLVPSPESSESGLYLQADGTWSKPKDTIYTHPSYTALTGKPTANATPGFGEKVTISQITSDSLGHVTGVTDRTITIPNATATTGSAGLMSAADKIKLNNIAAEANKYILPEAATNALGGIKIAKDNASYTVATNTSPTISANVTTPGKYYGVEIDSTGKAYVYVPWTDNNTTYSAMTASEATTGTSTTARSITAKVLHDKITEMLPDVMGGATSTVAGTSGLVPASAAGDQNKFLRADGTWVVPTNTTYSAMTASEATAGTATTARSITAKVLHDKITEMLPEVTQTATSGNEIGSVGGTTLYAPIQTSVSGNAGTATKLATARRIDGVKFDGSSSISHYSTCSTAAGTAAKTVDLAGFELVTGSRIAIKFTVTNTAANPTLNVNSTGARAIMYRGSAISAGYLAANRVYEFIYDGTDYELVGDINTNTTYSGDRGISLVSGKFGHSNTAITEKTAFVDTNASISVSSNGGSFKVTDIKYDAYGHIIGSQDRTITLSEPHKGTVTSITIEGGTGISVDNSNAITSSGTRTISLDTATTSEIGGMMASNALTTEVTLTSGNGTTANRYYGVQVDKNGKAFVNIPWTDGNTYTSAYSSTAAGTAAKTASCTNYTLKSNSWLHVTIVNSNTSQGAITLNVNSKGAKPIHINGAASSSSNYTLPAGTYLVYYDGTAYQFNTNGILPGTSSKASTLATSRTLTIGSTGKAFNGSANVSWTLAEIGAAASSHKHAYTDLTGFGTTANQAIVSSGTADGWNLYTLGSAAGKTASTSISSSSTDSQVPTAKAVYTAITTGIKANDAMIFKGTLGTNGTVTALPASHKIGDTYRVITAGSYAGVQCEVGDLVICITAGTAANNAHWTVAQTNIDGAVVGPTSSTDGRVALFSGTSGKVLKQSSYTLGCSVPSDAKFTDTVYTHPSYTQVSSGLYKITTNSTGHITAATAVVKADITALGIPGSNTTYGIGDYDTSGLIKPWKSYTKASTGPTAATSDTAVAVNGITTTSGRYYAVEIDSAGRAFVNVPWTDNDTNTDTKVKQTSSTGNAAYPILTATTASPTSGTAYESYYNTGVTINPSTKTVTATTFSGALNGNATTATTATKSTIENLTPPSSSTNYYNLFYSAVSGTGKLIADEAWRTQFLAGTTSATGWARIILGNSTGSGTAGNLEGQILLYSTSTSYHTIKGSATTSVVTHTLPATTGTILNTGTTSITAVQTSGAHIATLKINGTDTKLYAPSNPSLALGTTATTSTAGTLVSSVAVSGHTVTMTKYNGTIGSTTKPAYFNAGVPTVCSTYAGGTAVTLNGTSKAASTASFYAPTAAGTSGQVLVSSGGAPGWKDFDEVGLKTGTVTQAITTSWANIVTAANMATYCPEAGTYAIQVSGSSIGISSGIFSWNSSGSTNDEILLHRTGASTNIYLRLSSRALQIAGSAAVASGSISIKVKRLI